MAADTGTYLLALLCKHAYTLDYPASGDWMFTKKFYEVVGDRLSKYTEAEIQRAKEFGLEYFTACTYSCDLGTFKPDEAMYIDALQKAGCEAQEAVFIDDSVRNLQGAAKQGITPILIAANPISDVETDFLKIHTLSELLV